MTLNAGGTSNWYNLTSRLWYAQLGHFGISKCFGNSLSFLMTVFPIDIRRYYKQSKEIYEQTGTIAELPSDKSNLIVERNILQEVDNSREGNGEQAFKVEDPNQTSVDKGIICITKEIQDIENMTPRELRLFAENLKSRECGENLVLWGALSRECLKKARDFRYFDAVRLLQCLNHVNLFDRQLFMVFAEVLTNQASCLQVRHIVALLDVFESKGLRPRLLYAECFHNLVRNSSKMYAEEFVDVLRCLASLRITNHQLLNHYCRTIATRLNLFRYNQLTLIVGALRSLNVSHTFFFHTLEQKLSFEAKVMTVHEVYETLKSIKFLEFSWEPYERLIRDEFVQRTASMQGEADIDELEDPFECLQFMKLNGLLSKQFLGALCKWCAGAVYRPPTRSYKRPLAHQLVELHDLLCEYRMEDDKYLKKAILKFVSSSGGLDRCLERHIKPIEYQKGRRYFLLEDDDNHTLNNENEGRIERSPEENHNKSLSFRNDYTPNNYYTIKGIKKATSQIDNPTFKLRIRPKRLKNQAIGSYIKPT